MANSNPKTTAELQTDFLDRARLPSTTTNDALALKLLNQALSDMHTNPGYKFPWAERRAVLITHDSYNTGTIDVTAAARTTVTGTGTAWNTAVTGFGFNNTRAGGKMKLGSVSEIYVVSSVGSDTSITLETRYTGDAITAGTYTYFEDEYALASDFARFVDLRMFSTNLAIPLIGRQEFRRIYGRNDVSGKPKVATHIQLGFSGATTPRHRVVLHPYPDDEYSIPYEYVTTNLAVDSTGAEQERLSAATDEPIVPFQYRPAIVAHALSKYYLEYKDDINRSSVENQFFIDYMARFIGETKMGDDRPRFFVPKRHVLPRQRFDVGNRFDELRDR